VLVGSFTKAVNAPRLDPAFTAVPGLSAYSESNNLKGDWDRTIGMSPTAFFSMIANGLPGAKVSVSLEGPQAVIDIECKAAGKTIFKAENCVFEKGRDLLTIAKDRRESEVRSSETGTGLGKIFLSNMINTAKALGAKTMNLYGGKEDGTFFWPRYGAELENGPDSMAYTRFVERVEENMTHVPDDIAQAARAILEKPSAYVSVELANLAGTVDGRAAGAALLRETNTMLCYRLDDADKMAFTRARLGDVDALRANVTARYTAPLPGIGPQTTTRSLNGH